jgi:hypothetical protein
LLPLLCFLQQWTMVSSTMMVAVAAVTARQQRQPVAVVGAVGAMWQGRLIAVAAWQHSTAAMDYGKAMVRGSWHSTVAVMGGNSD